MAAHLVPVAEGAELETSGVKCGGAPYRDSFYYSTITIESLLLSIEVDAAAAVTTDGLLNADTCDLM